MSSVLDFDDSEIFDQKLVDELTKFCYDGNFQSVQRIIEHDPTNTNCCDSEGRTPLYAASCSGNIDLCVYLLNNNADIAIKTSQGFSSLHGASSSGNDPTLALLLRESPDVNCTDANGDTPLHLACCRGHEECVNLLLASGARIDIKNKIGNTAICEATASCHFNIIQIMHDFKSPRSEILRKSTKASSLPPSKRCHSSQPLTIPDSREAIISQFRKSMNNFNFVNENYLTINSHYRTYNASAPSTPLELPSNDTAELKCYDSDALSNTSPDHFAGYHVPFSNAYKTSSFSNLSRSLNNESYCSLRSFSESLPILSNSNSFHLTPLIIEPPMAQTTHDNCKVIIEAMIQCFQPTHESLQTFKLSLVKQLALRAEDPNMKKDYISLLYSLTIQKPFLTHLLDECLRECNYTSIWDLYNSPFFTPAHDFSVDLSIPVYTYDIPQNGTEIVTITANSMELGCFNINMIVTGAEDEVFLAPKSDKILVQKLFKSLSKHDPSYQLPPHPCILKPFHMYYGYTKEFASHIPKTHTTFLSNPSAFFLLTPVITLNLRDYLGSIKSLHSDYNINILFRLLAQCLLGVSFLKQNDLVHRNIAPQTILIDSINSKALLSDFSCCLNFLSEDTTPSLMCSLPTGIPKFSQQSYSPELAYYAQLGTISTKKLPLHQMYRATDVYSVGRSFMELIFMAPEQEWPEQKFQCELNLQPSNVTTGTSSKLLYNLLINLVSSYPEARLSPLNAAHIILTFMYYENNSLSKQVTDTELLSVLMNMSLGNSQLDWTSLYFHTLCAKEDIISAREFIDKNIP